MTTSSFDKISAHVKHRVFPEDLCRNDRPLVLVGSFQSELPNLLRTDGVTISTVVWSMWEGYLAEPSGQKLRHLLSEHEIALVQSHTSGHATPLDLERLIRAMNPTHLIPIHTEHPEQLKELAKK